METSLILKRVGDSATNCAAPEEHCSICNDEKWGDILVKITPLGEDKKYICIGCLLHHYEATAGDYIEELYKRIDYEE